eukprot:scaffold912_cov108-Isochrysis_galbana.AAC.10
MHPPRASTTGRGSWGTRVSSCVDPAHRQSPPARCGPGRAKPHRRRKQSDAETRGGSGTRKR